VGPILGGLEKIGAFRVLALPDHPTPLVLKTHSPEPVPFVIFSSEDSANSPRGDRFFDETCARETGLLLEKGHELMEKFIQGFSSPVFP
jgi:2,3-bisphosphoglycerate-independent phosphoglycerate mutase